MITGKHLAAIESQRIQAEYDRRERQISHDLYAPWQAGEIFMRAGRKFAAARMLRDAAVFPQGDDPCLEIGFGSQGWLGDLITWGVNETALHGIELNAGCVNRARQLLPMADLRVGDASDLPWESSMFRLVICSTVFTSILEAKVRQMVADEITRVLAPGGALLWYDFAINNPQNANVRRVPRKELSELFPKLNGKTKSVTLVPVLARLIAPRSWAVATLLESIPLLRTHLVSVRLKTL